jgi:uncharacterized membrane protein YbhN (UPF0104 family)/tRNA A-37 threonylcarbamoyl transferase component Bud32
VTDTGEGVVGDEPADGSGGLRTRLNPRTWRQTDIRIFSSASDAARARRPTDLVLLIAAALSVIGLALLAPGTSLDTSVAQVLASFPGALKSVWQASYDLLVGWALFLLVAALVSRGRKRLFGDEILAALLAFGAAVLAGMAGGTSFSSALNSLGASDPPAIFPSLRLAVTAAIMVTASPHLSRPLRYVGRWIMGIGTLATIALGVAVPIGVLAALAVALGAGAIVHLLFGSPGGRLALDQVGAALADVGVEASELQTTALGVKGVELVRGTAVDGRSLLTKVYGRDSWDGQLLTSSWEYLWYRDGSPHLRLNRLQQVEHEAFVTLLAERANVPVLPVIAAGMATGRDALLVTEITGRPLGSLDRGELSGRVLASCWEALAKLHDAGIAHGRLDARRLFLRRDGSVALGDFGDATHSTIESSFAVDRAQLLVTISLLIGHEEAVASATSLLETDALAEMLPYLQPAVLDRAARKAVRAQDWDLDDLRKGAAQEAGVDPPKLEKVRRVTIGSIAMVAAIVFVAYVIISAITGIGLQNLIDEIKSADLPWLVAALVLASMIAVPQAFSTMGASLRPVRLGPVVMLEYAVQFISLAVPSSAARVALEVRFFQKVGNTATGALAVGLIDSVCGFIVQMVVILVIALSGLASLDLSASGSTSTPTGKWLVVGLVVLILAMIVGLAIPRVRSFVKDKVADGKAALMVLRSPSKVAMIFLGNLAAQILFAVVLGLCLKAFGYRLNLAQLLLVYNVVSLFAGFMPVPGGVGVAEAGYTAGLVALGIPQTAAMTTAIMFRMVTYYLPPIWGGFAMKWLRDHEYV